MIEMVYSGKESEELKDVKVPKNIRQIGDNKSNRKVYIEDYVMTYLKKKPEREENVKYGVFLGEIKRTKGCTYIFIRGMVETREIIENSLIFNDDIWAAIYKDIKTYFEGLEIIGWFVSVPYRVKNDLSSIQKIHLDNFAGNDKLCFISDRTENEEGFYTYQAGNLEKQQGYYIFYEKNERMKKYLKSTIGNRGVVVSANIEDINKKNNTEKTVKPITDKKNTKTLQSIQEASKKNKDLSAPKQVSAKADIVKPVKDEEETSSISFRELLKQHAEERVKRPGRITYGISSMLIIALLMSTVVMLNNYGELKNLKSSIEKMNGNDSVEAVNELLSSIMPETTSNNDEEITTGQKQDVTTENNNKPNDEESTTQYVKVDTTQEETKKEDVEIAGNNNNNQNDNQNDNSEKPASMYSGLYHTVTSGQTLYDISLKYYGTSNMVDQIKEANNIGEDYLIKEGQKIILP